MTNERSIYICSSVSILRSEVYPAVYSGNPDMRLDFDPNGGHSYHGCHSSLVLVGAAEVEQMNKRMVELFWIIVILIGYLVAGWIECNM